MAISQRKERWRMVAHNLRQFAQTHYRLRNCSGRAALRRSCERDANGGKCKQMEAESQKIIYHSMISRHATMAMDLEIAGRLGFDGIEISAAKVRAFLAAGHSIEELQERFASVDVQGFGFLLDLERHDADQAALIAEATEMFDLAATIGAKAVQILTGPVDRRAVVDCASKRPQTGYWGVLGLPRDQQLETTSANIALLADIAAQHGLVVYLEALGWLPLNRIADQVELIERAGRKNVKLVVDFWHCYVSGDSPKTIAGLDRDMICGVHVCDSLFHDGGIPDESVLRDVPIGDGVIDLQAWTDAVLSTGFEGWWSAELFCVKQHQDNSFTVAADLQSRLTDLVSKGGGFCGG